MAATKSVYPIHGNQFVTVHMSGEYPYSAVAHCATCGEEMTYLHVPDGWAFEYAHRLRHGQYAHGQAVPLHEHRP